MLSLLCKSRGNRPEPNRGIRPNAGSRDVSYTDLQATYAGLLNGILSLSNGQTLVRPTRFADTANASSSGVLQFEQTSAGVAISVGSGGEHFQPGGPGTVLQLYA